jgi:hypothetical protein
MLHTLMARCLTLLQSFIINISYFTDPKLIHNEFQYAVFGRVTKGDDTLSKLERLPTRREGIFVMVRVNLQELCFMYMAPVFLI